MSTSLLSKRPRNVPAKKPLKIRDYSTSCSPDAVAPFLKDPSLLPRDTVAKLASDPRLRVAKPTGEST
jgi:hypothetical protein